MMCALGTASYMAHMCGATLSAAPTCHIHERQSCVLLSYEACRVELKLHLYMVEIGKPLILKGV